MECSELKEVPWYEISVGTTYMYYEWFLGRGNYKYKSTLVKVISRTGKQVVVEFLVEEEAGAFIVANGFQPWNGHYVYLGTIQVYMYSGNCTMRYVA